jgi:hypothetical protein
MAPQDGTILMPMIATGILWKILAALSTAAIQI